MAAALLQREASVRAFTDAAEGLAVQTCREKVKFVADECLSAEDARVVIRLRDGRQIARAMTGAAASMAQDALEHKFRELAAFGAPHCHADELLQALAQFHEMANATDLIAMTVWRPIFSRSQLS